MKICVVTPYLSPRNPAFEGHGSVRGQMALAHHGLVCDGSPPAEIEESQGTHVVLQRNDRDYGYTPRLMVCHYAMMEDAGTITFLHSDNRYQTPPAAPMDRVDLHGDHYH